MTPIKADTTDTPADPATAREYVERDLRFSVLRDGPSLILTLQGELDIGASESVKGALSDAFLAPDCKYLIADMSALAFIDSTGLGVFVNALQSLHGRDGAVYIAGCQPSIRRGFTVTRLDQVFPMFDTIDDIRTAYPTTSDRQPD